MVQVMKVVRIPHQPEWLARIVTWPDIIDSLMKEEDKRSFDKVRRSGTKVDMRLLVHPGLFTYCANLGLTVQQWCEKNNYQVSGSENQRLIAAAIESGEFNPEVDKIFGMTFPMGGLDMISIFRMDIPENFSSFTVWIAIQTIEEYEKFNASLSE